MRDSVAESVLIDPRSVDHRPVFDDCSVGLKELVIFGPSDVDSELVLADSPDDEDPELVLVDSSEYVDAELVMVGVL